VVAVVAHNLEVLQEGCVFLSIGTRGTTNNWAWTRKCRLSWVCSQKLKQTLCHNTYAASRGCSYIDEASTMFSSLDEASQSGTTSQTTTLKLHNLELYT